MRYWTVVLSLAMIAIAGQTTAAYAQMGYDADYPPGALARHEEGTSKFRVTVDTNGRARDCVITQSSGSSDLDAATCRMILERGRWKPATDADGRPIESTYSSQVRWRLPNWH